MKKTVPLLLAIALSCVALPALADPPSTNGTSASNGNGSNLTTWTSSDRFALIGCLTIGLGAAGGGAAALADAESKLTDAAKIEKDIAEKTGKTNPCPGESGCEVAAKKREEANTTGAYAGLAIGALLLGVFTPLVIYYGFQPKAPSVPNFMMKITPSIAPDHAGLVAVGQF